jgi:Heterokaryon incompatibility protein (HET)
MERIHCNYRYTPLREGTRRIYKNDGTFPPKMPEGEDVEDALFLTASTRNYHMITTGDIRILSLLPGSFGDPLQCRLTIKPIEQHPTYDALSYMWGNPSDTRLITVDGDQAFPVTVCLENALRHIRLQNRTRNLWVDAVCINQGDIKERSSQVNLMKEIYSRARLSTVWIDIELSPDNPCVRRLLSLEEDTALDDIGDDPKFWEPLIPLLQNPYWERLWVQQELVFAPKLEFHCRGVTIPGEKLMAFQLQIFRKSSQRQSPFHIPDEWTMLGNQMGINKTPSGT